MKLNNVAKTVVLGLAVLLASSAFASNKGTLQVREALEVNGQQLAPGEYQLRWDGTGANVEVSFMRGKKEVAKTTAKVIELRFAGKKFALAISATEKAEMSGNSSK